MGLLIDIREAMAFGAAAHRPPPDPADGPLDDAFAELVREALDELPQPVLDTLANTAVLVADGGVSAGAYGCYHGGGLARPDVAARIVLYRDTLTRDFGHDPDLLREQVRRTVRHELAHHLGHDEPGVAALGL